MGYTAKEVAGTRGMVLMIVWTNCYFLFFAFRRKKNETKTTAVCLRATRPVRHPENDVGNMPHTSNLRLPSVVPCLLFGIGAMERFTVQRQTGNKRRKSRENWTIRQQQGPVDAHLGLSLNIIYKPIEPFSGSIHKVVHTISF